MQKKKKNSKSKNKNKRKKRNERREGRRGDDNNGIIGTTTATLDDDTWFDILIRLPVKTLMRFKCVCKQWRSLIQHDPIFRDLHFTRSTKRPVDATKILFISSLSDYRHDEGYITHHGRISLVFTYLSFKLGEFDNVYRKVLDFDCTGDVRVLKPINGLVCLRNSESVLICNPTTGERTPWIKSTTSEERIEGKSMRAVYFGFGFDPTTKEHKVISIWWILERTNTSNDGDYKEVVAGKFCEVLTVGENKWRRIDVVVPSYFEHHGGYQMFDISVYVNGSIYWRYRGHFFGSEVLIAFDVGSEKFRVIPIPDSVIDPQTYKFAQTVELTEVDGRIAVVRWDSEWWTTLCIFDDDNKENTRIISNGSKWFEEPIIEIPSMWSGESELKIEAIEGTDPILLYQSGCIYCYTRETQSYEEFQIQYDDIKQLREINANFVESLLPVQKHQHSTDHQTPELLGN